MANVTFFNGNELMTSVKSKFKNTDSVLDIGCGIVPQQYILPKVHICCEPFGEYVKVLQKKVEEIDDRFMVVIQADWETACKLFPEKSVDTVLLVDVLEHLEKNDGQRLIKLTERIARKQIAIFTPLGFFPQSHPNGVDAWGLNGGVQQEHKSGWYPEDFNDTWDAYVAKEFHFTNSLNEKLEKPFGAFWIIKNIKSENKDTMWKITKNQLIDDAESLHSVSINRIFSILFKVGSLTKSVLKRILKKNK